MRSGDAHINGKKTQAHRVRRICNKGSIAMNNRNVYRGGELFPYERISNYAQCCPFALCGDLSALTSGYGTRRTG